MLGLCGFFMGVPLRNRTYNRPIFYAPFTPFDQHFTTPEGRDSSYTFRVFSPAFDADRGNGIKPSQFLFAGATIDRSHNSQIRRVLL